MQVILILGAAVWPDGPSPTLQRRCDHALSVWRKDQTQFLVPCGGLGQHPPAEADVMRKIFIKGGVPTAQIIPENRSTTTYENIRNARNLLVGEHITRMTIVSEGYHLPRAAMVARHFGFRAIVSCPPREGTHWQTQARSTLREAGAIPLYAFKLLGHKLRRKD